MLDSYPTLARLISLLLYCLISIAFFLWLSYVLFRCYCHSRSPSSLLYFHEAASTITVVRVMEPQIDMQPQIGLDEAVIETFPKFIHSEDQKEGSDQTNRQAVSDCAVCLGTFEVNEMLRRIPKCGHVFHAHCVDVWLRSHATCPYCRANLLLDQQQRPQHQANAAETRPDSVTTVF